MVVHLVVVVVHLVLVAVHALVGFAANLLVLPANILGLVVVPVIPVYFHIRIVLSGQRSILRAEAIVHPGLVAVPLVCLLVQLDLVDFQVFAGVLQALVFQQDLLVVLPRPVVGLVFLALVRLVLVVVLFVLLDVLAFQGWECFRIPVVLPEMVTVAESVLVVAADIVVVVVVQLVMDFHRTS